jgi:coiled-coil domain-containing protein 130
MAERKATNKYLPPHFDPKRHQSVNALHNRDTIHKKHGVPLVRFEMPFHVWCLTCSHLIHKGVRFNATKTLAGKYLSSSIWEFSLKCPNCKNQIDVRTDPKSAEFIVHKGAKIKQVEYSESDIGIKPFEQATNDPLQLLERKNLDLNVAQDSKRNVELLVSANVKLQDDYAISSALRAAARVKKAECDRLKQEALNKGLGIELLPHTESDSDNARRLLQAKRKETHNSATQAKKSKRREIMESSIF